MSGGTTLESPVWSNLYWLNPAFILVTASIQCHGHGALRQEEERGVWVRCREPIEWIQIRWSTCHTAVDSSPRGLHSFDCFECIIYMGFRLYTQTGCGSGFALSVELSLRHMQATVYRVGHVFFWKWLLDIYTSQTSELLNRINIVYMRWVNWNLWSQLQPI